MAREFKNDVFKAGEVPFGVFYPRRYIIAAFATAEQANQAVTALQQADYEARHWTPQQILERHQHFQKQRSLAQRVEEALSSDEEETLNDYLALAKQGCHFVDVYVPEEAEVAQAESILKAHQAQAAHYYGDWELVDLSVDEETG